MFQRWMYNLTVSIAVNHVNGEKCHIPGGSLH